MEEKEKGNLSDNSESYLQPLLDSFNQFTLQDKEREMIKTLGYSDKEITLDRYAEIGFAIVRGLQFPPVQSAQKYQILSKLSWAPEIDNKTREILNLFKTYCLWPETYSEKIKDEQEFKDEAILNLSWRALLDIETDVPCKFLLEQGSLIIPSKIVQELIEMSDFPKHRNKFIHSPEQGKQVLSRLDFVLKNGASVTIPFSKASPMTPLEYVAGMVSHLQKVLNPDKGYLSVYRLSPWMIPLHCLYYKNILTLFVKHLKMNKEDESFNNKYGDLPVDQIIEKMIERS